MPAAREGAGMPAAREGPELPTALCVNSGHIRHPCPAFCPRRTGFLSGQVYGISSFHIGVPWGLNGNTQKALVQPQLSPPGSASEPGLMSCACLRDCVFPMSHHRV